jgi:integrase/recombinase XerD
VQIERYVRWMQEIRRFKPFTVSRRMAAVTGFYRTCVIDAVLEHSPADYVRRPLVPAESPTLGLSHLQFEALLTAARESPNVFDFALVTMLGLLGLRIFEACGADIADVARSTATASCEYLAKARRSCWCRYHPQWGERWTMRSPTGSAARSSSTDADDGWIGIARPAGYAGWRRHRWCGCRGCIHICCGILSSPPCSTLGWICGMSNRRPPRRPRTTMRYDRALKNLHRHPNYILAAYMASGGSVALSDWRT